MKSNYLSKTWVVCLIALLCCLLWGSAFPCIKIGYRLFEIDSSDTGSQILFAGCRFTLAGVLTILASSLMQQRFSFPKPSSFGMVVKLCLVQTILQYLFFYIGLANASGVTSSIIEASNVFLALLASCLLFHYEKLTSQKVTGCLIGFAGVILISWSGGAGASMKWNGEGFIFLSAASYAISAGLIKQYSLRENAACLSGYQFLMGGIVLIFAGLLMGGKLPRITASGLLLLFYLACVSAIAYTLWAMLLQYNPVGKVSVFGFMNPVFGVILSALLLGEKNQAFRIQGLAALILVCIGITVVNRPEKPSVTEKEEPV